MTLLKTCACLLLTLLLSACSTTANKDYQLIEREYVKKPLISDHHLKLSLLNRPIPQDQLMMLAFAQARITTEQSNIAQVGYISIKGLRAEDKSDVPSSRRVIGLAAQDSNAISILGPSQL